MMDREDLLRELELLPIWRLRKQSNGNVSVTPPHSVQTENKEQSHKPDKPQLSLRLISSVDNDWLFLLKQTVDEEAEQLLKNILKAIGVVVEQDTILTDTMQLSALQAKVIVVMGEFEAQQLLDNALTIKQLRGKTHMLVDRPVVVTYSLQHLLTNLPDKAMAWEDLCLAKLTIANL